MTDTLEAPAEQQADEVETEGKKKRGRTRDFTKSTEYYDNLAAFVNERSGLDPVSPLQVKATLALRADYANLPEQKEAREKAKAEREAEAKKYEGMTDEQKKAAKAADRAARQAEKLQEKLNATLAKAEQLKAAASGSGEDLQAIVEAEQSKPEAPAKKRGLRRG